MDDALRVHDNIDIIVVSAEKVVSFDDLQALVHHRGAVHRDFCTHIPVRMLQRISYCHLQAASDAVSTRRCTFNWWVGFIR